MKGQSTEATKVQSFFNLVTPDFDAIYSGETGALKRWLNRSFRGDMYMRFERTMLECGVTTRKRILDIGCGSGRYTHELAARGGECVGIDFAGNMIELAREIARNRGVAGLCRFVVGDYMTFQPEHPFDTGIAIGYFDYIAQPAPVLAKMRTDLRERLIATFPIAGTARARVRKLRLGFLGCPVYFYRADGVERIMREAGWRIEKSERIGQLLWVSAAAA
jgi:SAM-dependent methyltransferase